MRNASSHHLPFCLVGLLALGLGGCNADSQESRTQRTAAASPTPAIPVELEDLEDAPADYEGLEVRISGEVDESSGDYGFVVRSDDWFFPEEVLVLARSPIRLGTKGVEDGTEVVVIGTTWHDNLAGLERELGYPLSDEVTDNWEDKAIVVAKLVRTTAGDAEWIDSASR